jgi:bifunctional DNA-binding transcriptional regulator/antitoxin component of YhaV-PrlF toxin-antitoxin module
MVGRVQECGCIALPEELQELTGLYPGATYEIALAAEGTEIVLRPLDGQKPGEPKPGTRCA